MAREAEGRMTKGWLGTPEATRVLDRLTAESQFEAESEERAQRERNDTAYLSAVREWFRRTNPVNL